MIDPRQPIDQRLERMERKLDLILAHLGIEYLDPAEVARVNLDANIDSLLRQGRQIEAAFGEDRLDD